MRQLTCHKFFWIHIYFQSFSKKKKGSRTGIGGMPPPKESFSDNIFTKKVFYGIFNGIGGTLHGSPWWWISFSFIYEHGFVFTLLLVLDVEVKPTLLATIQRFMFTAVAEGEIINGGKMSSPLSFDQTTLVRLWRRRRGGRRAGGEGDVTSAALYTAL